MFDCDQRCIMVQPRDEKASHWQLRIHDIRRVVLPISIRDSIQTVISDAQNSLQARGERAEGRHLAECVPSPLYRLLTILGCRGRLATRLAALHLSFASNLPTIFTA